MLLTGLPLRRQLAAELIRARQEKIARVLVKPSFENAYMLIWDGADVEKTLKDLNDKLKN